MDYGQDDDESPSAEDKYQIVSVCTLGVAHLNKKLQKHFSGEKRMTQKDLEAAFVEIDDLMKHCREHVQREFVHLDSDIVGSIDQDTVSNLEAMAASREKSTGNDHDEEESDGEESSSPPPSPTPKKKGRNKGKGKPGPKGKDKSSTSTSNGQVSGYMAYILTSKFAPFHSIHIKFLHLSRLLRPSFLPKKDRPASQAGPRDDDKGDGNGLRSGDEDHDDTSPTGTGEDNTDASPTQDEVVVKVRFEDVMYTHIFILHILDHADRSLR